MAPKSDAQLAIPFLTNDELDVFSLDPSDLAAFMDSLGLTEEDAQFQASQYEVADKADLVGVPLFLIQWRFKDSEDYANTTYVVAHAVRMDNGDKVIVVDGGTGVCAQLQVVTSRREEAGLAASQQGLVVKAGLVRSDYKAHVNAAGDDIPAGTTYYLG